MKIILTSLVISLFFVWTVTSTMKEDSYRFDIESKDKDPMSLILEEIWILEGIKCRAGYYNMSDELVDAIYHCAKIEHTKVTRKKFSDERVQFGGATPFLCLRSCMLQNGGFIPKSGIGLNETALFGLFKQEMTLPGGERSAFKLTKQLMECSHRHPTKFPTKYNNCTETEDLFRCTRSVMLDCNEDNHKFDKEFMEYLAHKSEDD